MSRRSLVWSAAGAALLLVGSAAPAHAAAPRDFSATALAPTEAPIDFSKTASGRLADTDLDLLRRSDDTVVSVLLKVDVDPVGSYTGGIAGFAPTSPEVTGTRLDATDPATTAYRAHVEAALADAAAKVAAAAPSARVTGTFALAYGGLAVTVEASEVAALADIDVVAAVQEDAPHRIPAPQDRSPTSTAAPTAHEQPDPIDEGEPTPDDGATTPAEEGAVIGVIGDALSLEGDSAAAASVIVYPAVSGEGSYSSDVVAAVEQGMLDGVRILVGPLKGSGSPYSDPVQLALLDAYAAGICILASAGESSADAWSADQPAPWVTTVAASALEHTANVAALVVSAHPGWTPGQVASALRTTAPQPVGAGDSTAAPDPRPTVSGVDLAVSPTLTISETAENFRAIAADPSSRLDLNLPSVTMDPLPGAAVVTRTVVNVTDRAQVLMGQGTRTGGITVTVSPAAITLEPGQSQEISIVVDGTRAPPGRHDGSVTITSTRQSANAVVIPVAVDIGDARLTLGHTCSPTDLARSATTTCTVTASNVLPVDVVADIDVSANPLLQLTSVTSPATQTPRSATWSGTLAAAAAPTIVSIEESAGAEAQYLPLSAFGIEPIADMADDSMVSVDVPHFRYGGETYSRIAVGADGFVVVGGATSSDNRYGNGRLPDARATDNVLAPLWTDLDPGAGGAVRVAVVHHETARWLVVDWEAVPTFSGNATNTFQVWVQLGGVEGQWFSYERAPVADAATPALIVAGNRDGTSEARAPLPVAATTYAVETEAGDAASTVSFDYTLQAELPGSWSTLVTLRSSTPAGMRSEQTVITVE